MQLEVHPLRTLLHFLLELSVGGPHQLENILDTHTERERREGGR